MEELWNDRVTWEQLEQRFRDLGVAQVQIKFLSRNHNSKNQIAGLGGDLAALGHLFLGPVTTNTPASRKPKAGAPIYRTSIPWTWLTHGGVAPAPETKLIYYPQYPEIRLSGFLEASPGGPTELLSLTGRPDSRAQEEGRILIFGPGLNRKVYAAIVSRHSTAANYLAQFNTGRGKLVSLSLQDGEPDTKESLFAELRKIHHKGWINSYRLMPDGTHAACDAPNCLGVTLESELGITANGLALPDYLDWEVKAHKVSNLEKHLSARITLLTPNPDSGPAKDQGTVWLTQNYGTYNPQGSSGPRWDLSGLHKAGAPNEKTGLEFGVAGFDVSTKSIIDDGYIYLRDTKKELDVARWSFAKLLTHWQKKHAKAVFVPTLADTSSGRRYKYGTKIHVGEGTTFPHFLAAVVCGSVVMDPGLNSKMTSTGSWKPHTRFQFRASLTNAEDLYKNFEKVTL